MPCNAMAHKKQVGTWESHSNGEIDKMLLGLEFSAFFLAYHFMRSLHSPTNSYQILMSLIGV